MRGKLFQDEGLVRFFAETTFDGASPAEETPKLPSSSKLSLNHSVKSEHSGTRLVPPCSRHFKPNARQPGLCVIHEMAEEGFC